MWIRGMEGESMLTLLCPAFACSCVSFATIATAESAVASVLRKNAHIYDFSGQRC